ncbi:MAG TPA: putative glycoside hydrolase [Terriglobales bacterium]|nr:putative glycoside hydrolase [Terriglobales bacterium]
MREYISHTPYMTGKEFEAALRDANHKPSGIALKPGEHLVIPSYESAPIAEHAVAVPRSFQVKAIYLTGIMAGSDNGIRIVRKWHELGGNAVVFDIKDSDGSVSVAFENPLAPHLKHHAIRNLPKFIRFLHENDMHAIARIALFRDELLARDHPALAVQSARALKATAATKTPPDPWRENGKLVWADSSNPEVQAYDLALAKFVAGSGVDEIQFDYVRFPAEGDQADARFAFMSQHPGWTRADVISDFLDRAYRELHPTGVLLSLDVFGVMAWHRHVDLAHTGQDIARMAQHCDVLSPMIYPSHFFGMDGYALPGDAPEHFISESMQKFEAVTVGSGVVLRPWLQAFAWRTKTYSPQYIETQVLTAKNNGGIGFLFWNARNDYNRPFAAMPQMNAEAARYFQPVVAVAAQAKSTEPGQPASSPANSSSTGRARIPAGPPS